MKKIKRSRAAARSSELYRMERSKVIEKDINKIVDCFGKILKGLKIGKESDFIESQLTHAQINNLQCCIASEEIVISCHNLLTVVEDLKNILIMNEIQRMQDTIEQKKKEEKDQAVKSE